MSNRYIVIMAGGRGERFWPLSRLRRPKHLLPIVGDQPMISQTLARIGELVPPDHTLVVTNCEQRQAVLEILPQLPPENIVGEPMARDTAAAVGLSAVLVGRLDPQAAFAILPSDHVIQDEAGFRRCLATGFEAAENEPDALVTIGIRPDYPATGYGYIQRGSVAREVGGWPVYQVTRFVEKPDRDTASGYLRSGRFLWNAGMFISRVAAVKKALSTHAPKVWRPLQSIQDALQQGEDLEPLLSRHYPAIEKISIDYAVMEKAASVLVLESGFDWDDVGEWPAVARHFPHDEADNVIQGKGLVRSGRANIVVGDGSHLTVLLGVDDLIVVQTEDATLVCHRSQAQQIKDVVKELAALPEGEAFI